MRRLWVIVWAIASAGVFAPPISKAAETPKRVQPPEWSRDVLDAFFEDAREQLVGERPTTISVEAGELEVANAGSGANQPDESEFKWSALIDADTLATEIKRINNQLGVALRKSGSFQAGGNLLCRRDFGLLAVLFGVVREFDEDVRWKRHGQQVQSFCFRACQNCKTASAQSFTAAKDVLAMLEDLFRGQTPAAEWPSDPSGEKLLVDRPQLMLSMERSVKEHLSPALASSREFRKRFQRAAQQAQVLAVLAEVIQQEGYEYADDGTYLDEARQLREAAGELSRAAKEKDYEAARAAAGRVRQSCSRCHEGYRG